MQVSSLRYPRPDAETVKQLVSTFTETTGMKNPPKEVEPAEPKPNPKAKSKPANKEKGEAAAKGRCKAAGPKQSGKKKKSAEAELEVDSDAEQPVLDKATFKKKVKPTPNDKEDVAGPSKASKKQVKSAESQPPKGSKAASSTGGGEDAGPNPARKRASSAAALSVAPKAKKAK